MAPTIKNPTITAPTVRKMPLKRVVNATPKVTVSSSISASFGTVEVSVYRDRKGNLYVRQKNERLTPAEKRKGLTRASSNLAKTVKEFYSEPENLGYKLKFSKPGSGIERTRNLRPATIDGRAGWFDTRTGKFLFKELRSERPNQWGEKWKQYGTIQLNLRSLDSTAYGLVQKGSLEEFYLNNLNAKEKAKLTEALAILDWENEVYSHFVSSDPDESAPAGRPDHDEEKKGYDTVLSVIEQTVGPKWRAYLAGLGA